MGIRTGTAGIDPFSEIPGPGQNWFLSGAVAWKTGQGEAEPGTGCFNPGAPAPRKTPGTGIQPGLVDFCRGLSRELQLPVWPKAIKRVKYTISQTTLDREERQNNMQLAFCTRKDMAGITVAIIDDVLTTGSTISSLAGVIKDAGVKTVVALTVAAPLDHLDDTLPESL